MKPSVRVPLPTPSEVALLGGKQDELQARQAGRLQLLAAVYEGLAPVRGQSPRAAHRRLAARENHLAFGGRRRLGVITRQDPGCRAGSGDREQTEHHDGDRGQSPAPEDPLATLHAHLQ